MLLPSKSYAFATQNVTSYFYPFYPFIFLLFPFFRQHSPLFDIFTRNYQVYSEL